MSQYRTSALSCGRVVVFMLVLAAIAGTFSTLAHAANNGLAQKPLIGWSSWSSFHKSINEALIRSEADAMAANLKSSGYTYINMDSGWTTKNFDSNGRPTWDTSKFPSGIPALASYVHSKGLKLGIYLKPGLSTTVLAANSVILGTSIHVKDIAIPSVPGDTETGDSVKIDFTKPGADTYVQSIVNQLASWGVDFVKMDFTGPGGGNIPADSREYLQHFMAAIESIHYPLWVELSNSLSFSNVTTWQQVSNGWRIDGDIESGVSGTLTDWTNVSKRFKDAPKWAPFAGSGGWSDFDALQLGAGSHDGLSVTERQTAATLWAVSCAQFFSGADLRNLDSTDLAMMTNAEVIAVDQAGNVATPISQSSSQQVWRTQTANADGSYAVALFNLGSSTATVSVTWSQLGFSGSAGVHDLWSHADLGTMASGFSASLPSHGSRLLRVTPSAAHPDFTLSATPASQTVLVGNSVAYTVNVGAQNGFNGSVSLGVSGIPASASASFSPASINTSGSSALNISTTSSTPAGTYTLTITGTSGSLSHTATVTLVVNSQSPDFSLSVSPSSQTISPGSSATYTATITALNGFSGSFTFTVSGLPAGATASFNPTSVNGSGSSTLTVSTTSSTPAGNSTLTITGTSGSLSHMASTSLTVQTTGTCVTATGGGGWINTPFASQSGAFTVSFDATPSASKQNALVALSSGAGSAYTAFANLVNFETSGVIDARNGGAYSSQTTVPYTGGLTYHLRLVVNVPAHTYSIFVTPPGGAELTIGTNFAFRTEQNTVTHIDNYGALVNATAGTIKVCNFLLQ